MTTVCILIHRDGCNRIVSVYGAWPFDFSGGSFWPEC
jgi:hypothetical protein